MSAIYEAYSEKRSYLRLEISANIQYRLQGSEDLYEGKIKNLSGGGIQFFTEKDIPIGETLNAKISSDCATVPPLSAILEVIRTEPCSNHREFSIAAKVVDIT